MRYFYTDPLAAAWMAKHFGMEFQFKSSDGGFFPLTEDAIIDALRPFKTLKDKAYINPNSLHLLEPQADDVMMQGNLPYCVIDSSVNSASHEWVRDGLARIIQRNGIAFMWPERDTE